MKKIICLFLILVNQLLYAQQSGDLTAKITEYLDAHSAIGNFNGTFLIAKNGNVIYKGAYGLANYEWKIPNTIDTKFRLASVTKQFTATIILQLVQETKLKLDDKISDHLPYYRKDIGQKVNIRQLLTHCSGIPGYTEVDSFFVKDAKLTFSTEQFVKKHCSSDLAFEPGTQLVYNNSAYFILGAIIEQITGTSYAHAVETRIFKNLGMKNSGYDYNQQIIENRAYGYAIGDTGQIINSLYVDMSVPFSAGSLYSTVDDLHQWDRSFYQFLLLTPEWTDSMFSKKYSNFGYGWVNDQVLGKKANMHSGGINGFSTVIYRIPEDQLVVIALMNNEFGNAPKIGLDLMSIYYNKPYTLPKARKAVSIANTILLKYVGDYELAKDFIIQVTVENNVLFIQATGQQKIAVKAESETEFFIEGFDIALTFQVDKKNKVTGLILHQSGDHKAKKIK